MRELNVCEVGAVAGGSFGCDMLGAAVNGGLSSKFGGTVGNIGGALTTGLCNQVVDVFGNGNGNGNGSGYSNMGPNGFNSQGNALGGSKANSESGD